MINNKVELIREHMQAIMNVLEIKESEDNKLTPLRVAKMFNNELFVNRNDYNIAELNSRMKTFPLEENTGVVVIKHIKFYSMCSHHWLPFMGTVDVGYLPEDKIIGLSKIPRVVKYFSKRPQIQERLVKDILKYLTDVINPQFIIVRIRAEHTCMSSRGIESEGITDTVLDAWNSQMTEDRAMKLRGVFFKMAGDQ